MIAGAWLTGPSFFSRLPFAGLEESPTGASRDPRLFVDPTIAGFASSDGVSVAGEIRIDNRDALIRTLDVDAAVGDVGLMVQAFRRWGPDSLSYIHGDFAIAIWDSAERRLLLARDSSGQRPLHYRRLGDGVVFASLPIALAALSGSPRADLPQIVSYLSGLPQFAGHSFVHGVNRVRPGYFVLIGSDGRVEEKRWWNPDLSTLRLSHADALAAVAGELRAAVGASLRTDSAIVAADLSGGLDSSLIVATAAGVMDPPDRLLALTAVARGPVDRPLRLFGDESERASATARINGVRHELVFTPPPSPLEALSRWLPAAQEPIANACNLDWIDNCYAAARNAGADVYLTGGRGNLTITRPAMGRLNALASGGRFVALGRELARYRRFAGGSWPGLLAMSFSHVVPDRIWNVIAPAYRRASSDELTAGALLLNSAPVREAVEHSSTTQRMEKLASDEDPLARFLAISSIDEGNGNLAARRLHGLEMREPLSARRLVELSIRLPAEHYFRDGRPRALARDLLAGKAPPSVVNEPGRGWQGANWRAGFEVARPEMIAEIDRIAEDSDLQSMLDTKRMRSLVESWPQDNWTDWAQIETYRNTLFRAIGAARFVRFVREWPAP